MGNRRTYSRRSVLAAGLGTASAAAARRLRSARWASGWPGRRRCAGPGALPYPVTAGWAVHRRVPLRPHRAGHAGEPLVRQLPRHAAGQRAAAGRRLHVQQGGRAGQLEPGGQRAHVRVPPVRRHRRAGFGLAVVGRHAPADRRRRHGRLRRHRSRVDGLLHRGRPALLLLAGQHLHAGQPLVLLGAGADLPQPPLLHGGHGVGDRVDGHRQRHDLPAQRDDLGPAQRATASAGRTTSATRRRPPSSSTRSSATRPT